MHFYSKLLSEKEWICWSLPYDLGSFAYPGKQIIINTNVKYNNKTNISRSTFGKMKYCH